MQTAISALIQIQNKQSVEQTASMRLPEAAKRTLPELNPSTTRLQCFIFDKMQKALFPDFERFQNSLNYEWNPEVL